MEFNKIDCVIVDSWEICRMQLRIGLDKLGIAPNNIYEASDEEEALGIFHQLRMVPSEVEQNVLSSGANDEPVLVFVRGHMITAVLSDALRPQLGRRSRESFRVRVSSKESRNLTPVEDEGFHCSLPGSITAEDLNWVMQQFSKECSTASDTDVGVGLSSGEGVGPSSGDDPVMEDAAREAIGEAQSAGYVAVAADMGGAMTAWLERKDRKKKDRTKRSAASYGSLIRERAKVGYTAQELMEVCSQRWPSGKCVSDFSTRLGSGASADVYLGAWHHAKKQDIKPEPAAIKVFHTRRTDFLRYQRELEIGKTMRHPNLVAIYEGVLQPPLMIVQEYCAGGTVHKLLQGRLEHPSASQDTVPTFAQRLKISLDVARGMQALHGADPPIIHRDLKSENVLLVAVLNQAEDMPLAKVADFGMAREVSPSATGECLTRHAGSMRWMAPEVMKSGRYCLSADVYSYGVFLFELVTGGLPYDRDPDVTKSPLYLERCVSSGLRPDAAALGRQAVAALSKAPTWTSTLMHDAWSHNPEARPSFSDIIGVLMEHMIETNLTSLKYPSIS
jgi:hypothetical protein